MSQSETNLNSDDNSTEYFSQIPLWKNEGRCFEVLADNRSGRIPVTRLESWQHFAELLESPFFNRAGVQLVFRGQRRYDWSLMPTLGRLTTSGVVTQAIAQRQLEHFQRAVRGRLKDNTLVGEEDELWSIGQHHGLMTPLLDWTYSPYVALFFAFAKPDTKEEEHNPYRVIYVLNKSFVREHQDETDIRLCEPQKDSYGRLVNQAGLFTFSPYGDTIENRLTNTLADGVGFEDKELSAASVEEQPDLLAKYICKIYIRNTERDACLRHLRRMNVHPSSLFPDLIGASEYCNIITAEETEIETREAEEQICPNDLPIDGLFNSAAAPNEPSMAGIKRAASDIEGVLRSSIKGTSVRPESLTTLAIELAQRLAQSSVVDWAQRDDSKARMRNLIRSTLRGSGYPAHAPEKKLVEQLIDAYKISQEGMLEDGATS